MPAHAHPHRSRLGRAAVGVLTGALAGGALSLVGVPTASAAPVTEPPYAVTDTIALPLAVGDGMAVDSTHHKAYVTHPDDNAVSVVDLTTDTVTATIPVGGFPFRVAIDEELDRAYVGNTNDGTVSEIDTTTDAVVRTIEGFSEPRGLTVDPASHRVYVANFGWGENLASFDPTSDPVDVTTSDYVGSRPWSVAVDPTTSRAYVITLFGDTLASVTGTTVSDVLGGFDGPINVALDPTSQQAYVVTNNDPMAVFVVDVAQDPMTTTGSLPTGPHPSDVVLDAATGTLFVSDLDAGTVSVIDQTSNTRTQLLQVGTRTTAVDLDTSNGRAYVLDQDDHSIKVVRRAADQAITFTSTAPTGAHVGDSYTATATGGESGQPVTFSTSSAGCTVSSAGEVSFTGAGDCVVAADQAAAGYYLAAPTATQTVSVSKVPTDVVLDLAATSTEYGVGTTAGTTGTSVPGTVQYSVDGDPVGAPQTVVDGATTLPAAIGDELAVGTHQVGAEFTPTDDTTYAASTDTSSLSITKATTVTTFGVLHDEIWTSVTRAHEGTGSPSGTVEAFVDGESVGTAAAGAPVAYSVPAGATRNVSVVYSGDSSFEPSSASSARKDPILTATLSSRSGRHNGWYRSPVTVRFHCTITTEALTSECPSPVTLTANGGGQSVSRTIIASDGGAATRVVSGIDIDRTAPAVRLTGVRNGATYFAGGPAAHCVATDALSGLDRCTVTTTRNGNRLIWTARATDRAGNVTVRRVAARSTAVWIDGARVVAGRPVVREGRTYTVLVESATRPSYQFAAPAPRRPAGGSVPFHRVGKNRWALGVTMDRGMAARGLWNLGIRTGSTLRVVQVKVVR